MSKLFSISLSLLVLFQSFGLRFNDLVQIDAFITHAQFHSEAYGDNVLVFISKHYGDLKAAHDQAHQEEKKDHETLPFQQQSPLFSLGVFAVLQEYVYVETLVLPWQKAHNFHYLIGFYSPFSEGLFQPPRLS